MLQGDVKLFQTTDGGEITVTGGVTQLTGGLDTAVYLSLFGGNFDDDGSEGNRAQWWGNFGETEDARKYRSKTQYLLRSIPATSGNLRRVEEAVLADLAWMLEIKAATEIKATISIPGVNRVKMIVDVRADSGAVQLEYIENWQVSS